MKHDDIEINIRTSSEFLSYAFIFFNIPVEILKEFDALDFIAGLASHISNISKL